MKDYDFGLNWSIKNREIFINALKSTCQRMDMTFLWISNDNVREVIKRLERNEMRVKFLLDTEATYNRDSDPYARVCYAVKDLGGTVINDPDRARLAVDKSVMHYELVNAGIQTPYSVIVRNWESKSFRLTDEERQKLGSPFVIKPACGYSRMGVIDEAQGSIREIAQARNFDVGDNFLLQEKINPVEFKGRRAWFRVFHVFDKLVPCWWDDRTSWYQHVAHDEFHAYRLSNLVKIVSKIAEITRMVWFSTEIAIDSKDTQRRFVTIDYVNDQCDMTAQSCDKSGVPDHIVTYVASCIVESVYKLVHNQERNKEYAIWLHEDDHIQLRGLPTAPELLTQIP
ncbi:MAG: hypothetical protein JSW40_01795 [Candidatus Omnitrophota bacterium]|nr:MAG: hypothetical protein JSW40_01795 [Candidatus Omnitrophota bacterium]